MPTNLHHAQEALRAALGGDALPNVDFVSTIEDAVRDADLAIDCVPDELESKLEILWLLDRMAPPRTVLATPTTRLSIADLANCTYRADKCVAIAEEASRLTAGLSGEILLRTTKRTTDRHPGASRRVLAAVGACRPGSKRTGTKSLGARMVWLGEERQPAHSSTMKRWMNGARTRPPAVSPLVRELFPGSTGACAAIQSSIFWLSTSSGKAPESRI